MKKGLLVETEDGYNGERLKLKKERRRKEKRRGLILGQLCFAADTEAPCSETEEGPRPMPVVTVHVA